MRKSFILTWATIFGLAMPARAATLSESLNNIPTASSVSGAESFVAVQGGIGKKIPMSLCLTIFQPFDLDLTSLSNATSTGMYYRSAGNTWDPVTIGTGLSFTGGVLSSTASGGGGAAVWGSITGTLSSQADLQTALDARQPLDLDLTSLAAAATTGTWYYRSASNTWAPVVIGSGLSFSAGTLSAIAGSGAVWGSITGTLSSQTDLQSALDGKQASDPDLTSLAAASGTGLYYRSVADTWSPVTIGTGLSLTTGTLAVTTIAGTAVSFADSNNNFAATNVDAAITELDSVNGLGPNATDGKVHWSQLDGVPSGFADGVDDTTGGGGGGTMSIVKENGTTVGTTMTTIDFLGADFDISESPTGEANISIANDAITFAKMQNIATNKLLGRSTASTGDIEEITIGAGLSLSGGTLSATGSGSSVAWGSITGTLSAQTDLQTALDAKQPLDGDLTALAAIAATGSWYYRSATNVWSPVTVGSGLSFTGGSLSVGDLSGTYQPLDSDLLSLAAASTTNNIYYRSATNTWSPVTIGAGLSFTGGTLTSTSSGVAWGAITGTMASQVDLQSALDGKQPLDADLTSLAAASAIGNFYYRSSSGAWNPVSVGSGLSFTGGTLASTGAATWGAISGTLSSQNDLQTALDAKQPLDADLTALAGISTIGSFYYRSAANVWTPVTIGAGLTFTGGTLASPTTWGSITGTLTSQSDLQAALDGKQPLDADLTSLAGAATTGNLYYRSAANTWAPVTVGSGLSFSAGTLSVVGGFDIDSLPTVLASGLDADDVMAVSVDGAEDKITMTEMKNWIQLQNLTFSTINVTTLNATNFTTGTMTVTTLNSTSLITNSLQIMDSVDQSHGLTLVANENLTSNVNLNLILGGASRTLTMTGNASISGTNTGDQTGANPTGTVGTTAVNGSATTFMRSDAAPAISQSMTPSWTGLHTFNAGIDVKAGTSPGAISLYEGSGGGTNKVTLTAQGSVGTDRTLAIPDATATFVAVSNLNPVVFSAAGFSSVVVPSSGNMVLQDSTDTLTNKTFDASATGNILKMKSLPQFTSPGRVDGTNCTIGTTSTAVGYGLANFTGSNSVDQANNWCEFRILVPQDWDTAVDPTIKLGIVLSGADTGTQRYVASVLDPASSASATGAPGTPINIDFAADASGASGDYETVAAVTLTGWGTIGTPGNLLILRIARDSDAATVDTSTVASILISAEMAYGATQ